MSYKNRFLQTLGLCKRAGAILSGYELMNSLGKNVHLLVLASNASERTQKQIKDKSKFYKIDLVEGFSSDDFYRSTSLQNRMVLGITNKGLADKLYTYIKENEVTQ